MIPTRVKLAGCRAMAVPAITTLLVLPRYHWHVPSPNDALSLSDKHKTFNRGRTKTSQRPHLLHDRQATFNAQRAILAIACSPIWLFWFLQCLTLVINARNIFQKISPWDGSQIKNLDKPLWSLLRKYSFICKCVSPVGENFQIFPYICCQHSSVLVFSYSPPSRAWLKLSFPGMTVLSEAGQLSYLPQHSTVDGGWSHFVQAHQPEQEKEDTRDSQQTKTWTNHWSI